MVTQSTDFAYGINVKNKNPRLQWYMVTHCFSSQALWGSSHRHHNRPTDGRLPNSELDGTCIASHMAALHSLIHRPNTETRFSVRKRGGVLMLNCWTHGGLLPAKLTIINKLLASYKNQHTSIPVMAFSSVRKDCSISSSPKLHTSSLPPAIW